MGTVNVLEACRSISSVQAIVVVTTDKCYELRPTTAPYRECDRLGGHDPYAASKAAAELAVSSYRAALAAEIGSPLLATARAGNVIGGGDWAEDRLIPDVARACASGTSLAVRSPSATRPWQHVLDCLAGYLQLGATLMAGRSEFACAWNFGPAAEDACTVAEVLTKFQSHWPGLRWHESSMNGPHEASTLTLDSTRARTLLGWRPVWTLDAALAATASWYRRFFETKFVASREQLDEYAAARRRPDLRLPNA